MTDTTDKTSSSKTAISSSTSSGEFNLEPCSSTSDASSSNANGEQMDQDDIKELIQQASMSMQVGKRHMYVQDFQSAVPCFEIACEFLNKCYGLRALECAEAYLNYGISLYELSRTGEENEDNIVNVEKSGGGDGEDDDDDDEEEEEEDEEEDNDEEEDVEEGKETNDKKKEYISVTNVIVGSNKDQNLKIDKNLMDQPSTSKGVTATSSTNGVGKNKDDENDDDDNATNIEIAYEVLTTAKEIYSEHLEDKEMRLNYAEALQKLGEISIDWENADGAIEYLNECLKQRQEVLEPDDRLIAVTHHYLALAKSLKYDAETSTQSLKQSLEVIQLRINNLKSKDKSTMTQFEIESTDREIQQMESLIPEIHLKMEEIKEQIRLRDESLKELELKSQEAAAFFKAKPINSVSHLLKRKRNDQENGSEKETNKTIKIDPSSSTSSSSTAMAEPSNVPASSGSNINPSDEDKSNGDLKPEE